MITTSNTCCPNPNATVVPIADIENGGHSPLKCKSFCRAHCLQNCWALGHDATADFDTLLRVGTGPNAEAHAIHCNQLKYGINTIVTNALYEEAARRRDPPAAVKEIRDGVELWLAAVNESRRMYKALENARSG
ncbi:hypothetical protein MMC13_004838 [Lambiella insularis]|nr:hypothetical protein [Lambiella insularis]